MRNKFLPILIMSVFILNGCAVVFQRRRPTDVEKIEVLSEELQQLKQARDILKGRLERELRDQDVRLRMAEKGLVITFVAEVLFDSGRAEIREQSKPILNKVARVLREEVAENEIGVEGHTDNVPIKHSPWASNWELSAQRALSVLYYLESENINPRRLSAIGYGPYRPVASNETEKGRQLNRRVEIVVLPNMVKELKDVRQEDIRRREDLK